VIGFIGTEARAGVGGMAVSRSTYEAEGIRVLAHGMVS
jgi:hypothetical protein